MQIRPENVRDRDAIHALIQQVFGRSDEAALVDALRQDGDLTLSLVAEEAGRILGHVVLSEMRSPARTRALAPLSVAIERQRQGLGTALVQAALERTRGSGCDMVFVLGDPDYYGRFGFSASAAECFPSPFAGPYLQAKPLSGVAVASAPLIYARAFDDLE